MSIGLVPQVFRGGNGVSGRSLSSEGGKDGRRGGG